MEIRFHNSVIKAALRFDTFPIPVIHQCITKHLNGLRKKHMYAPGRNTTRGKALVGSLRREGFSETVSPVKSS